MNFKIRYILVTLVLVCVHISYSAYANSNDDFANAITISNIHDYCSSNAQFDNLTATADGTRPSGWQSGPKNNVWFKFQATTPGITIELKSGGVYGTLNSPQLALYTAAQAELNSNNVYNKEWISLSYDQLTVGDWYYINVDVNDPYNTNKKGTFTLCLDDEVSNDFKAGATELTNLNNWSSGNAALTNVHGTPDGTRPAGWGDGPKYNVWYKFQATTSAISIDIKSGNEFGTMDSPQLALYDASDNLIDSKENYNGFELSMNNDQLTPGAWYFICIDVDDKYNTYRKQGTFTLYVSDSVNNDLRTGAIELTDLNNWCSADAAFTNAYGTPDGTRPSGWQSGPRNNVWFKFQATTQEVTVEVKSGGNYGTLNSPQLALYDDAQNELNSNNVYNKEWLSLSYNQLTVGSWYYINVDVNDPYNTNKRGSFTLCINDKASNDFKEGVIELTDLNNWCSGNAAFRNDHGTPDGIRPSEWGDGPKYNVWFKFQATTQEVNVEIKSGGTYGTLTSPQLALYDETQNELNSNNVYNKEWLSLSYNQLTVGNWYYINVDVNDPYNTNKRGTFTLCINDEVSNDFKEGAIELTELDDWCSSNAAYTNVHGTPDGNRPVNWSWGPDYNVWFKFQAETEAIEIELKSGGEFGTLISPQIALYNMNNDLLYSEGIYNGTGLSFNYENLASNHWYYINVDVDDHYNENTKQGTFSLCTKLYGEILIPKANSFEVTPTGEDIVLNWVDTLNEITQYDILRKDESISEFQLIASLPDSINSYIDQNLIIGREYLYKIRFISSSVVIAETYERDAIPYSQGNVPDSIEYEVLVDFYNNMNGPNWNWSTNWLQGKTQLEMKTWAGVIFNNGDIEAISIQSNNVSGDLIPEITKLTSLKHIYLGFNNITKLPKELGLMPSLQSIAFNYNKIDTIPAEFGNLQGSNILLDFKNNELRSLPFEIIYIPNLELDVRQNYLDFEDLDPYFNCPNKPEGIYHYAPQKVLFTKKREIKFHEGGNINLEAELVSHYGNNLYQWQKYGDGAWINIAGENDYDLNLTSYNESILGEYRCKVESSCLTELTLFSPTYNIIKLDTIVNNYDKILYVSMEGIDSTAVVDDLSHAWALPHVASVQAHTLAQSDGLNYLVYVRKGTYEDYWVTMPGVDIYFEEDAVVWYNTDNTASRSIISDWRGGAGDYSVLGKGRFYVTTVDGGNDRDALNFKYNSTITIECKEFNSMQLWNQFNSPVEFNNVIMRSPQLWNQGLGATYNYCLFSLGYLRHTIGYNINGTHEVFNNCTFILPDSTEVDENLEVTDHNGNPLFSFQMVRKNLKTSTINKSLQEVADLPYQNSEGKNNTVASFSVEPALTTWLGWVARCYTFTYTLNNPTFIVNRPNCFAVRVIWSESNPDLNYSWEGLKINGGKAEQGVLGTNVAFLQADKIYEDAADIPIYINGTTYDGFTERVFATDYFPMGVNIAEEYYAIQSGSWNNPDTWAVGGTSNGTIPAPNSNVIIDGYAVTVSDVQECGIINLNNDQTGTSLIIDNGDLTVNGNITISNANSTNTGAALRVVNGGKIEIKETQNP